MEKELKVTKIKDGTVLDHLSPGTALEIIQFLHLTGNSPLVIATNVDSTQHGQKDVVKIEDKFLSQEETNKLSLLSPNATINIIKNYEVKEKRGVERPELLERAVNCPNKKCVTNSEDCQTKFLREGEKYRCYHCERLFPIEKLHLR